MKFTNMKELWQKLKVDDCIRIDMENESAIMRFHANESFKILNSFGTFILEQLTIGSEFEQFVREVENMYQISREVFLDDVSVFLQHLLREKLIYIDGIENNYENKSYDKSGCSKVGNGDNYEKVYSYYMKRALPFKVFFELTYQCNLRCNHCYLGDEKTKILDELSYDKIINIIDQLSEAGVKDLVLTGGEVGTRSDFIDIVKYAVSKKLLVTILSNGTLFDDKIYEELIKINVYDIRISMYGPEIYHDKFVKLMGSYEKSITLLEKLNKDKNIGTAVYILTDDNYRYIEEMQRIFKDKGIKYVMNPFIFSTLDRNSTPTQYRIREDKLVDFVHNYDKTFGGGICVAGISRFRITPDGSVNPCEMLRHITFGNLKTMSFSEILNSEARKSWLKEFNEIINNRKCHGCSKEKYCSNCIGSAYLETGSYYGISDYSCHAAEIQYREKVEIR